MNRKSPKAPNPIDVLVGQRIRLARVSKGISQTKLADALGLTFQQVQKYEKGKNRVGSSRLARISETVGYPISWFFGEGEGLPTVGPDLLTRLADDKLGLKLALAFLAIPLPHQRRALLAVARLLAGQSISGDQAEAA
jgi:transcriptional regulator with XRE-family HTH domain